ncbi:MAG: NADH-quinone oxidoreductase subunit NuoN [Candidatus Azosocius agrarius]|nr:MAG: NADH-quinone oxidoreductase subunit NuoN [Gammaproteobacteria bacterium]
MFKNTFILILPEIILTLMTCIILIFDLFLDKAKKWITYFVTQITLIIVFFCLCLFWNASGDILFDGSIIIDKFSILLKIMIIVVSSIIFIYSKKHMNNIGIYVGEYFVLVLTSILGMMIMVSSANFLTLYLGVELLSLPLYALISITKKYHNVYEASIKYFVMGSIASAVLLFGVSFIYGISGTINFVDISYLISEQGLNNNILMKIGLIFIVSGFAFKFGVVPFHMWVPDVYHGSPISVTLLISTIPKIAVFGIAYRLLSDVFGHLSNVWEPMLIVMSLLSLLFGNIVAIAQKNIKRMFAYSAIAHMGFVFLGLVSGIHDNYISALFYIIVYVLMSLGVFSVIICISKGTIESEFIEDFKGLNEKNPWIAFIMLILLLSMSGIPPTIGFYAKFLILREIVNLGYFIVAVIAVLSSVIGSFYYLRLIKVMYFDKSYDYVHNINYKPILNMTNFGIFILSINGLLILFFGIFPFPLLFLCQMVLF